MILGLVDLGDGVRHGANLSPFAAVTTKLFEVLEEVGWPAAAGRSPARCVVLTPGGPPQSVRDVDPRAHDWHGVNRYKTMNLKGRQSSSKAQAAQMSVSLLGNGSARGPK
jgi:hypothetical protein